MSSLLLETRLVCAYFKQLYFQFSDPPLSPIFCAYNYLLSFLACLVWQIENRVSGFVTRSHRTLASPKPDSILVHTCHLRVVSQSRKRVRCFNVFVFSCSLPKSSFTDVEFFAVSSSATRFGRPRSRVCYLRASP